MFPALDEDLHFGYQLTGSLVVARGPEDEEHLQGARAPWAFNCLEPGGTNRAALARVQSCSKEAVPTE